MTSMQQAEVLLRLAEAWGSRLHISADWDRQSLGCCFGPTYVTRKVIHPGKFGGYIGEEVTAR